MKTPTSTLHNARQLRQRQTKAESLLWNAIRGKRLSGLKFRRQHPVPPYVVDFVCPAHKLVVEIDGGYHDYMYEEDEERTRILEQRGYRVLRYSNEDVIDNVESVAIGIATELGVEPIFGERRLVRSGMKVPRKSK